LREQWDQKQDAYEHSLRPVDVMRNALTLVSNIMEAPEARTTASSNLEATTFHDPKVKLLSFLRDI
jgi:hypothetical protein